MKRILYVEANEDGTVGGSHKIQADLVTRLSGRYEPLVLYYEDNPWAGRMAAEGLPVCVWEDVRRVELAEIGAGGLTGTLRGVARAVRRRIRFLRERGIDLVHLNNSPLVGMDDWLPAARVAGIPCVAYMMGEVPYNRRALRRWALRGYSAFFPLSRYMAARLEELRAPPDRVVLTFPGVDVEGAEERAFAPPARVRAELGVAEGRVLALMVGNLREWKGQHVVIEAVGHLPDEVRSHLTLLLVGGHGPGEEPYVRVLEEMIAERRLHDVVRIVGRRDDVPDLLEAADIAVHASTRPEPFGLVVQEAMLHGCAVVAAGEGGPVEMLTPECGLLFDPARPRELASHLELLVTDARTRRRLAVAARARARDFDVRRHVALVEDTYARLLS